MMLVVGCLVVLPSPAQAWGSTGHSVVAEIAERRLAPAIRRQIEGMLGGASLASISMWADTMSAQNRATRRWHHVNMPVTGAAYDRARDCDEQPEGDCVVEAIERSVRTLSNPTSPKSVRVDALKLLVHLVADVHQPLHCAERQSDQGGNLLEVEFFGSPTNLHSVWDFGLLDHATFDWGEHVGAAISWLETQNVGGIGAGTPAEWASESHRIAVEQAYDLPEGLKLSDDYESRMLPIVHQQLAKAGVRLAFALTRAMQEFTARLHTR
jgi:hypothetical protein